MPSAWVLGDAEVQESERGLNGCGLSRLACSSVYRVLAGKLFWDPANPGRGSPTKGLEDPDVEAS